MRGRGGGWGVVGVMVGVGVVAGLWGCLSVTSSSLVLPPVSEWRVVAESAGEGFEAGRMLDGDTNTFWRAGGVGGAEVRVDFGRDTILAGFSMVWGDSYASNYVFQTSRDGETWKDVFEREGGDGGWDQGYFDQTMARWVRIMAEGGGEDRPLEIRSLALSGLEERVEVWVSDGLRAPLPVILTDGDMGTFWHCPLGAATLTLDFHEVYTLGSVRVDWGEGGGAGVVTEWVSDDGEEWRRVAEVSATGAGFDMLLHAPVEARMLRLSFSGAGERGFDVAELRFRGREGAAQPWVAYALAAEQAAPGIYPDMFRREQVYWTVALRAGGGGALLDEWGNFAPSAVSPMVSPLLVLDGRVVGARQADELEYALGGGGVAPMPMVRWRFTNGLSVAIRALAGAEEMDPSLMRVDIVNEGRTTCSGALALLVRPVRIPPQWGGGFSPITSLRLGGGGRHGGRVWQTLLVNELPRYALAARAGEAEWAAVRFDGGDIARVLTNFPVHSPCAEDVEEGLVSGAWLKPFRVAPGKTNRTTVAARSVFGVAARAAKAFRKQPALAEMIRAAMQAKWPSWGGTPSAVANRFSREWAAAEGEWVETLAKPAIEVADGAAFDCMKTQVAFLLSRAVMLEGRPWDGWEVARAAAAGGALLRAGHADAARELVDEIAGAVPASGEMGERMGARGRGGEGEGAPVFGAPRRRAVEGGGGGGDPAPYGQFAHLLMETYRFTHDVAFLERHAGVLGRALGRLAGIPLGRTGEGAAKRRLWDRFLHRHRAKPVRVWPYGQQVWAMLAWKEGRNAAMVLQDQEHALEAEGRYRAIRDAVGEGIRGQMEDLPVDAPLPAAPNTAAFSDKLVALLYQPGGEEDLVDAALYQRSLGEVQGALLGRRRPGASAWFRADGADLAPAFAAFGDGGCAREVLCELLDRRLPLAWNTWPGVVSSMPRQAAHVMRMPSTEAAAAYVTAILSALVHGDEDGMAHLLEGAWPEWLQDGEGLSAKGLATPWGEVEVSAFWKEMRLTVEIQGEATPPGGWRIHWPILYTPDQVMAGGRPVRQFDETGCTLDGHFRGRVDVYFPVEAPWPRMGD